MNRQVLFWSILLLSVGLLSCSFAKRGDGPTPSTGTNEHPPTNTSIEDLRQKYRSAKSDNERRAVCLAAIDKGAIRRGTHVSEVDAIFGTSFTSNLPPENELSRGAWVFFAPQPPLPPRSEENRKVDAVLSVGWYADFDYDHNGLIQNYYLSNLHKGMSSRTDGQPPMSFTELQQRYGTAKTESERRDICLLAIDEGTIQIIGPIHVSTVDEIFGTHLAAELPTRKERARLAMVDFGSTTTSSQNRGSVAPTTWFLAVEYSYDGEIENYYLTNIHE